MSGRDTHFRDAGTVSSSSSSKSSRSWRDAIGVFWVVGAGIVTLLSALVHGTSLGPMQNLSHYGVLEHSVPVSKGQFQFFMDPALLAIPWKALAWTEVHNGHLPLWNPYNVLGMPLAFNWESAPFSLSALLGYLAPLRLVFTISVITSLMIGGTGVYVLCRVLRLGVLGAAMAGTVYELSGPFMNLLSWQDTAVLCWAGWLFAVTLLIIRGEHRVRHVVAFAVTVALAGYAGQPEALFFLLLSLGIFVGVIFLVRALRKESVRSFVRPIADLIIAAVAGLALFAPLALPALQLSAMSVRSKYETIDNVTNGQAQLDLIHPTKTVEHALSFHDLTHVLFQSFDGLPVNGGAFFADRGIYIETVAYLGVIAVVLAVLAVAVRRRNAAIIALAAMTVVMFCLVFVPPVVSAANQMPLVGTFLWNRALIPMAFGVAVLAGVGTDLLAQQHSERKVRQWFGYGFVGVALVLGALWLFGRGHLPAAEAEIRAHSFAWPVATTLCGLVLATALWIIYSRPPSRRPSRILVGRGIAGALIAVEAAFLVSAGIPIWSSSTQFLPTTPAEAALTRAAGSSVVGFGNSDCTIPPTLGINANLNAAYSLREFTVYDPMTPLAYNSSWREAGGEPSPYFFSNNLFCPAVTTVALARRYGVGFVLEPANSPGPTGAVFDRMIGNEQLYRIPGAAVATLSPLGPGGAAPGPDASATPVSVSSSDSATWKVVTDATDQSLLRLRLTNVPGWHATIDGKPLQLTPFAGVMLQARVPPGRHVIKLNYWPTAFTVGIVLAICSALGLCVAVIAALIIFRGRRRGLVQ